MANRTLPGVPDPAQLRARADQLMAAARELDRWARVLQAQEVVRRA